MLGFQVHLAIVSLKSIKDTKIIKGEKHMNKQNMNIWREVIVFGQMSWGT
jgi:hypothetical protein